MALNVVIPNEVLSFRSIQKKNIDKLQHLLLFYF